MIMMPSPPLFYAAEMPESDLERLVFGVTTAPTVDTINFTQEVGGSQERLLAIPYLHGMDTITITEAAFEFRVGEMDFDTSSYSVVGGPSGQGAVLRLDKPGRLRKVEIEFEAPDPPPAKALHVIVRPVDGSKFGPPIYSAPHFSAPGPTFGPVLAGMTMTSLDGNRFQLRLPNVLGTGWLIQVASGNQATELVPLNIQPQIRRVTIGAVPNDLSVALEGDPPTLLWGNPGMLLPDSGVHEVSFLPLAQKSMSEALKAMPANGITLPLNFAFRSGSAALLEMSRRALAGYYSAIPFVEETVKLRLGGRAAKLELQAPGGFRPMAGKVTLVAKMLGRELNCGSLQAPLNVAGRGLRANRDRHLAAQIAIAQRSDTAADAAVTLVSIAGHFEVLDQAEMVVELREDAAGRPGASLCPSIVHQFEDAEVGWLDLDLAEPISVAPDAKIWASIRMTKGEVYWHCSEYDLPLGTGAALVSADGGNSWGDASAVLGETMPLLVQAFHRQEAPIARPEIRIRLEEGPTSRDWFALAEAQSPTQYRLVAPFPQGLFDVLGRAVSPNTEERATTTVWLNSDSVLELSLSEAELNYDPAIVRPG